MGQRFVKETGNWNCHAENAVGEKRVPPSSMATKQADPNRRAHQSQDFSHKAIGLLSANEGEGGSCWNRERWQDRRQHDNQRSPKEQINPEGNDKRFEGAVRTQHDGFPNSTMSVGTCRSSIHTGNDTRVNGKAQHEAGP